MPSAVRRESSESLRSKFKSPNKPLRPCISPVRTRPEPGVVYHSSMMKSSSAASRLAFQQSPLWLFLKDIRVLFTMLAYLPNIFLPFKASHHSDELYMDLGGVLSMLVQATLFIVEIFFLLIALPVILLLPGMCSVTITLLACSIIYLLALLLDGSDTMSKMDLATKQIAGIHQSERWVFINGCATDCIALQKNVNLLSKTFGRPVLGIHNKSYGLLGDLLECLIQRCFGYKTKAVRTAYLKIKPLLLDAEVLRVILIGHSQGGIIISLVLDQLFTELSSTNMSKLEVYTFGSAASHFPNPPIWMQTSQPPSPSPKVHFDRPGSPACQQNIIAYIEHYANEFDMVPRWGVLHSTGTIENKLYAGSVFVRLGASGHFLNQHYLSSMFPTWEKQSTEAQQFLDQTVAASEDLKDAKDSDTLCELITTLRKDSGLELGTGQRLHYRMRTTSSSGTSSPISADSFGIQTPFMIFSRTGSGLIVGEKASGKTVRELSRLWKYLGGGSPDDGAFEPEYR